MAGAHRGIGVGNGGSRPESLSIAAPAVNRHGGAMRLAAPVLCVTLAVLAGLPPALAGSSERDQHWQALQQAYYRMTVAEYCGLVTEAVGDGFRRKLRALEAWIALPEAVDRRLRIAAARRADYEYSDYGLNGYKKWCERVGGAAVADFLAFRERELAKGIP
jgi:hypothetical protein